MKKPTDLAKLEKFAATQWGMFTIAQAQKLGLQRSQVARLVDGEKLEKAAYGTYRYVVGSKSRLTNIKAAWLSIYPKKTAAERLELAHTKPKSTDAVVCGRTAAYIHGFEEFNPAPYNFALRKNKQCTRDDLKFCVLKLHKKDIVFIDDLPVTSIERTLYDLAKEKDGASIVELQNYRNQLEKTKEQLLDDVMSIDDEIELLDEYLLKLKTIK